LFAKTFQEVFVTYSVYMKDAVGSE